MYSSYMYLIIIFIYLFTNNNNFFKKISIMQIFQVPTVPQKKLSPHTFRTMDSRSAPHYTKPFLSLSLHKILKLLNKTSLPWQTLPALMQ